MRLLLASFLASTLLHAGLFGGSLALIAWLNAHAQSRIDIDLAGSSLLPPMQGPSKPPPPQEEWFLPGNGKAAPKSQPITQAPVPMDWTPAALTAQKPVWSTGMITEEVYPAQMKAQGKEGRVIVDVDIDALGKVQGVSLVSGSEPDFNNLVVERLKQSTFRPALDQAGNPVPCRLRIPVKFQLQ